MSGTTGPPPGPPPGAPRDPAPTAVPPRSTLRRDALRGVAWTTVHSAGSRLMTAVVFVLLARLLEPAAFGLVALALVFLQLTSLFIDQGFGAALVQRQELTKGHLDTAFWTTLCTGVVLAGGLALLAVPLAALLGEPGLAPVLQVLSLVLVLGSPASTATAVLRRDLAFRTLAYRRLLSAALGGVAGVSAALLGAGVWSLVLQALVQSAVSAVALWAAAPYRPGTEVSRARFRELFGFSNRVLAANALQLLSKRADDLLIGAVLGSAALGLYSVAYRLLNIMTEVLTLTIDNVAYPTFSKLQDDRERLSRAYAAAIRASATIAFPAYVGVAVVAEDLVAAAFGPEWSRSATVLQVLALAGIAHSVTWSTGSLLLSLGRTREALRVHVVTAVGNVVGFAVTVPFGIVWVAVAFAVRAVVLAPVAVGATRAALGFSWWSWLRPLLPPLAAAGLMAAALLLLRPLLLDAGGPAVRVALSVPLAAVAYLAGLAVLAPGQLRELLAHLRGALPTTGRASGG